MERCRKNVERFYRFIAGLLSLSYLDSSQRETPLNLFSILSNTLHSNTQTTKMVKVCMPSQSHRLSRDRKLTLVRSRSWGFRRHWPGKTLFVLKLLVSNDCYDSLCLCSARRVLSLTSCPFTMSSTPQASRPISHISHLWLYVCSPFPQEKYVAQRLQKISGFLPVDGGLKKALTGTDVVIIPAGIPSNEPLLPYISNVDVDPLTSFSP